MDDHHGEGCDWTFETNKYGRIRFEAELHLDPPRILLISIAFATMREGLSIIKHIARIRLFGMLLHAERCCVINA